MTREEARHWLEIELKTWEDECKSKHPIKEALSVAIKALEQEPKTGHWVGIDEYPHEDYECDNCGFIHTFIDGHTAQYNYCPNCGCRMVEPQESENP